MHTPDIFWKLAVARAEEPSCVRVVVSGTFGEYHDPNGIAFGLKANGDLVSYGYAVPGGPQPEPEYAGLIEMLTLDMRSSHVGIVPYDREVFGQFPDVVGGLAPTADKQMNEALGRTFVGVRDDDGDGSGDVLLVYSSDSARQELASSTLQRFGAQRTMMLIGGNSAFLIIDGTYVVTGTNHVPHTLVLSGRP